MDRGRRGEAVGKFVPKIRCLMAEGSPVLKPYLDLSLRELEIGRELALPV
jgi:hypothetical protein